MAYKFQGIPKSAPAQLDDESKLKLKNEIKNEIMNEVRREIAKEIQELKEVIIRERDNRLKITNWIRDNLGPDLEHVKQLVDSTVDRKIRESQGSIAPSFVATPLKQTKVPVLPVSQTPNNNNTQPPSSRPNSQHGTQPVPSTQPAQTPPTQNQRSSTLKSSSSIKELQTQIQAQIAKTSISTQPGAPADEPNDNSKESQNSFRAKKGPQQTTTESAPEIYSDEEWTDTDEDEKEKETEQIKKKLHAKVAKANKRLVDIEEKMIPKASKLSHQDSSVIPTLSKANMQHSTSIHITTYGCATEVLFPKMKEFHSKGGAVIFVPPGKTETDPFVFAIRKTDTFYPVCPDGLSRSQIMYLVLSGMQRALGMNPNVNLPHGAIYGFDVAREDKLSFVRKADRESEAKPFRIAFGQHRVARFGESVGKPYINSADWKRIAEPAQQMREYFNLFYYKQPQKKVGASSTDRSEPGRIVFVVFAEAVPVVIDRLNEMNKSSLEKIVVIGVPFEDEVHVSKDHPDLKRYNLQRDQLCAVKHHEVYKKYASLFFPLLHLDSIQ